MSEFDAAVALLGAPDTWCDGAAALARLQDPAAIEPLLAAYESREESGKLCLLDALEALDAGGRAHAMHDGGGPQERRKAAHLMELFPSDEHLPRLSGSATADQPEVRRQALRALAAQRQTPAWEAAMIALLDAGQAETRAQAARSLSRRRTEAARAALVGRLARETDPEVRALIQAAVGG